MSEVETPDVDRPTSELVDEVVVRPGEAHELPPTHAAERVSMHERRVHQVVAMGGGDWAEVTARAAAEGQDDVMIINMGPQHPSTHGVLRLVVELKGEEVINLQPVVGYLHTGIEKNLEYRNWTQGVTFVTRMDYVAPLFNEMGYCLAVEKLLGIEVPERANTIRVLLMELNRISSHLIAFATGGMELGALTAGGCDLLAIRYRVASIDYTGPIVIYYNKRLFKEAGVDPVGEDRVVFPFYADHFQQQIDAYEARGGPGPGRALRAGVPRPGPRPLVDVAGRHGGARSELHRRRHQRGRVGHPPAAVPPRAVARPVSRRRGSLPLLILHATGRRRPRDERLSGREIGDAARIQLVGRRRIVRRCLDNIEQPRLDLDRLVGRRRRMLDYVRNIDVERYRAIVQKNGLRQCTPRLDDPDMERLPWVDFSSGWPPVSLVNASATVCCAAIRSGRFSSVQTVSVPPRFGVQ